MVNVILFRAQPFHHGHLSIVKEAFEDSKRNNCDLWIFIGSADKHGTKRNPFDVQFRMSVIEETLKDHGLITDFVHIKPLVDLSDEANNTFGWGNYLFDSITDLTRDKDITMWYTDNPSIMLSWFSPEVAKYMRYKFLSRTDDISATKVRQAILAKDWDQLLDLVPVAVYHRKQEMYDILNEIYNN